MPAEVNYADVLADLKAKQTAIEDAIRAITALMNLGASSASPSMPNSDASTEISSDAFFGMSIVEATKKFLGMVKKPRKTEEIMCALDAGGHTHTSKNFYQTVYGSLRREHVAGGEIIKVNEAWGLAEWYPNRRRDKPRKAENADAINIEQEDDDAAAITQAA